MRFAVRIPDSVLFDSRLTPQARALYGLYAAVPNRDPSRLQITATLGFTSTTTVAARETLVSAGLVTVRKPSRRIIVPNEEKKRIECRWAETVRCTPTGKASNYGITVWNTDVQAIREAKCHTALTLLVLAAEKWLVVKKRTRPSHAKLAESLGIATRSVKTARGTLTSLGLLEAPTRDVRVSDDPVPDIDTSDQVPLRVKESSRTTSVLEINSPPSTDEVPSTREGSDFSQREFTQGDGLATEELVDSFCDLGPPPVLPVPA